MRKQSRDEKLDISVSNQERLQIESSKRTKGDPFIIILTALLIIFGLIMVFSASYYVGISSNGSPYYYLIRQGLAVGLGAVLMLLASVIDYHMWSKFWGLFYISGLVLLVLVLFIGSVSDYGGQRWIPIGPFTLMPGEWAKIFIVVFAAGFIGQNSEKIRTGKGFWQLWAYTAVYAFLIYKEPNLSTAITVVVVIAGMMLIANAKITWLAGLGAGGIAAVLLYGLVGKGYQAIRIKAFLGLISEEASAAIDTYQVDMSLIALGSGGIKGLGLGNSIQKTLYLPMPQNDFILSIIGEELGFIGLVVLLLVYLLLIWRGCLAAIRAKDHMGMMLAGGFTILLAAHVILNVAVCTASMPATGIILPFISYGSNAMLIFMIAMGVIYNVSRQSKD